MATDPELLDRPARTKGNASGKAKTPARKGRSPTITSLREKVERAAKQRGNRQDIGVLTHAQRNKTLFGI